MYFTPDIILSFFIMIHGISFDINVLFMAIFWDFMKRIPYIVLQEIDQILGWGILKINQTTLSFQNMWDMILKDPFHFTTMLKHITLVWLFFNFDVI